MNHPNSTLPTAWIPRLRLSTAWEAIGLTPDAQARNAPERLTNAYLAILLFALPLMLHNGYFDITECKWVFYCAVSAAYLALLMLLTVLSPRVPAGKRAVSFCAAEGCMLLFALSFLISTLLSGNMREGLFGAHNRYQGVLTALLYAGVFCALLRNFRASRLPLTALMSSFLLVSLLAALQAFGLDPLRIVAPLAKADYGRYVSTLGNINFYSAYLSLLLPFVLTLGCFAETPFWRIATACTLFFGTLGMLPSGSESLALSLLPTALLLPLFLFAQPAAMRRYPRLLALMLTALALARLLTLVCPLAYTPSFFIRTLLRWPCLAGLSLFVLLLYVGVCRCSPEMLRALRRPYAILLLSLLLLSVLAVALFNTVFADVPLGAWDRFLKFSPSWGTDRGRIWAYCLQVFNGYGALGKLFGGGPSVLYALDADMAFFGDAVLDNAHNEYLHYLLTVGFFGLFSYLGALATTLRLALGGAAKNPLFAALALGVLGYALQAMCNIAQPLCTPMLFLFLGMAASAARGKSPSLSPA